MNKTIHEYCVASLCWGCAFALLHAGCAAGASQSTAAAGGEDSSGGGTQLGAGGSGGINGGAGSGGASSAGTSNGSGGSAGNNASTGGNAGTNLGTGGTAGTAGAAIGTGGTTATGGTAAGTGGTTATGGTATGTGGTATGAGGTAGTTGTSGAGGTTNGVARTVELIGPGPATCGATNATHGDGFVCVLNYPSAGPNVVGYWFDYAFSSGTCSLGLKKPSGNNAPNPQVCFSGSACPATSGGGLGVALCEVHGINVSTWPQLMMLESASSLSTTVKSPFSGCNPGATMTSVSWTLGSGSIPAGISVLFDDAADVNVARVDNLAAGATSVDVPASVDTSKVAAIKFSVNGATSASWNFCLSSVKVSMR